MLSMARRGIFPALWVPVMLLVAVLATACGGSNPAQTSKSSSPSSSSAPTAGGGGSGSMVTATETEFKIALSRSAFTPGTYTFAVKDSGHVPHSLEISGPGVAGKILPKTLQPGESGSLTVTLQPGTYELWCPVDGHKGLGMDLKIKVAG